LKAHFAEVAPSRSVDLYFFEAGYCGVQPVGTSVENGTKYVNVCAMVPPQCATDLQTVFSLNPALQERSRNWQQAIETVTTAPLIFRAPQANRNHVLLAGDAAGFVDPFVGDGISLALRSGSLAAESLLPFLRGECAMSAAIDAYSTAYARSIAPVFRSSSQLRRLFSLPKPARTAVLALLRNAPSLVRYAVRNTR
jgi:flavin-dependent dehydrogenase